MKYIREGRMGPPKSYKTGAVVSSYPKPMLVIEGDAGGLDVIHDKINWTTVDELDKFVGSPAEQITAIQFNEHARNQLTDLYAITPDSVSFPTFNRIGNALLKKCPFKTVVVDPVTRLSDAIYGHLAATQPGSLSDPRKWAANIGMKVQQTMAALTTLPCHVVFIMHSAIEKNEITGEIRNEPVMYSRFRDLVGALLSQFFFADIENGKPFIYTKPQAYVKGIGARWPSDLPARCGPLFNDIYGNSVKNGETNA